MINPVVSPTSETTGAQRPPAHFRSVDVLFCFDRKTDAHEKIVVVVVVVIFAPVLLFTR